MTVRGESKAMKLETPKVVGGEKVRRQCPHPYCFEIIFGHYRDLQDHYLEKHKCGRCNHDKHHKCKKGICACGCRVGDPSNEFIDTSFINKMLEMASKMAKVFVR